MKKFLKYFGILLLLLIVAFASFLGYMTFTDYNPKGVETLAVEGKGASIPDTSREFSFMIWNIGYAGLGAKSDFFFDGGKGVRMDEATSKSYLDGIVDYVLQSHETDFILLQEVDVDSRRSWHTNQVQRLAHVLPNTASSSAINYDSKFVPQPITNPYGQCKGGLLSISKYQPSLARRIALTPDADWPVGLFMLDRCLLEWRFPLAQGKELVVYNLHLSAYDDGTVKQSQMDTLQHLLETEYAKGNYVVAGGDWNQSPPGYTSPRVGVSAIVQMNVPESFPAQGWKWAFDTSTPTNRKLNEVYEEGKTGIDILDFYTLSPNIELLEVKGQDVHFANSDHQPVKLKIKLL